MNFSKETVILRLKTLRILALPLIILGTVFFLAVAYPTNAAPPANSPDNAVGVIAQESDVLFDKQANTEVVLLGTPVTYTIRIENNSAATITPEMVDTLPDQVTGMALQVDTITATVGTVEVAGNNVRWTGTLEPGDSAVIMYEGIAPTTSNAGQELENVATLEFDGTMLQASAIVTTEAPDLGIWGGFINLIAKALVFFDQTLASVGVPYAFGFAIILFTLTVRGLTFPLNMQQIKSSKAMQALQPQLKALQEKHKGDKEKLAQEQMKLYKEAGVNPLGGCLPMLVQMPIWFALYRSLIQLSSEGLLEEGFFWIPSLAGPVSTWGGGISWLWPFPPEVGWANAIAYLVMPVLLVVSQLYMQKLMTPPSSDPQQAQMQSVMKFMPLMFGYFALVVPSGLTLYWFTSNMLGVAQHYFTKTKFDTQPEAGKAVIEASSTPVPATPVPATSGDNDKRKNDKSKRRKRRKR